MQSRTSRIISAPVAVVFEAIAHIENFAKAVPHITNVEFLTEQRRGVGTRFRETRLMGKRENSTTLEVSAYELDKLVRLVSDEGGTIWDTVFSVHEVDGGTRLDMVMDVKPYKLSAKLMTKMIMGFVNKAIEADMDSIKAYCEGLSG